MAIMDNLRNIRKNKGYSQAQIAEVLETTQQQYSKYENGQHEIPVRHVVKLATFYKISADDILGIPKQNEYESLDVYDILKDKGVKIVETLPKKKIIGQPK